jgi:hypothetical protein
MIYWTSGAYERLSNEVFGNYEWPMHRFLANMNGGVSRLYRRFPMKRLTGRLCRELRMAFLVNVKQA